MLPFVLLALAAPPTMTTYAGTGQPGYSGDGGPAVQAQLKQPFDVLRDQAGNVYFSDSDNHCVRCVSPDGIIRTVAGCGRKGFSGDGGVATAATFNEPYAIALEESSHTLYIVDRLNAAVRAVDLRVNTIRTLAGTGKAGQGGDGGPAAQAQFQEPNGLALDGRGGLLVADVKDQRVRRIDLAVGTITTFAGTGKKEHTGDGGPAIKAGIQGCRAVAVARDGMVFICEREGNGIRRVNPSSGNIERYAGTGKSGYTGDGGPALQATFKGPKELKCDAAGNLYVVDTENQAIRRIDAKTHVITTVAGCGQRGGAGDGGPATAAQLGRPHGLWPCDDGSLLIADSENHRVRRVTP